MTKRKDLVDRVRVQFSYVPNVQEKRMFGSVAFMVNGKLCVTARETRIMCRIDPAMRDDLVARKGCRPMIMSGREYKGYVFVDREVLKTENDLRFWVGLALDFAGKA